MSAASHTIALVEDDDSLRETLAELLAAAPGWRQVAAYASA